METALGLISYIRNKATVYNAPFCRIIEDLNEDREYRRFCLGEIFAENLAFGRDIPDAWRKALEESPMCLEAYEKDVLINFGEKLCYCNKEEIESIAENALYSLKCFMETAVENRNTRTKSTAAICVSLGTIIILMFA